MIHLEQRIEEDLVGYMLVALLLGLAFEELMSVKDNLPVMPGGSEQLSGPFKQRLCRE